MTVRVNAVTVLTISFVAAKSDFKKLFLKLIQPMCVLGAVVSFIADTGQVVSLGFPELLNFSSPVSPPWHRPNSATLVAGCLQVAVAARHSGNRTTELTSVASPAPAGCRYSFPARTCTAARAALRKVGSRLAGVPDGGARVSRPAACRRAQLHRGQCRYSP